MPKTTKKIILAGNWGKIPNGEIHMIGEQNQLWWSEEEKRQELIELETIREQIAQADNIPNGNHYMELGRAIDKFIEQKRKDLS